MRWTILLVLLSLSLAGCGSDAAEPVFTQAPAVAEEATAIPAAPSDTPVPATATTTTELSPTQAQAEEPATAPLPTEAATAEPVPSPTETVVFNGPYEQTYFRGSAGAPVTIIDYSDFL